MWRRRWRIVDPVRGTSTPRLRRVKALAGVEPRDYDYSVFWVVLPLVHEDGTPLFSDAHGDIRESAETEA